jgi:hypothetical protein
MREMAGRRGEVAEAAAVGDKEAVGWRGEVAEAAAVGDKKANFWTKKSIKSNSSHSILPFCVNQTPNGTIPFYFFV